MLDLGTFLTRVSVLVDDLVKTFPALPVRPGPKPTLSRGGVITPAILSQWKQFGRQAVSVRYAHTHLRTVFPGLPDQTPINCAIRARHDDLVAVGQAVAEQPGSANQSYRDSIGWWGSS
jgi:hypothetical protein